MNRIAFVLALAALLGLTFFVYFSYPEKLRKRRWFQIFLLIQHGLGTVAIGIIFTVYHLIPVDWGKWLVARIGTFYYEIVVMLTILFGIRMMISKNCQFLMRRSGKEISPIGKKIIADKAVHSIIFLIVCYTITAVGFFNINCLHRTDYSVHIQKNSSMEKLDVTLIADIHAGAGTWRFTYDDLAKLILETNPDVLLIAGDVFDETTSERDVEYLREVMSQVHPPLGSYFVYGNHDDYTEDWAAEQMRQMGVTVLEDEKVFLGDDIQLIGRLDSKESPMELTQLQDALEVDFSKPALVLQHRPKEFKQLAGTGYDLVMAGHTHGLNIPQGVLVGLTCDMFSGQKEYGDMNAIVTSGVSAWGLHYKFPAISEVVSIHITFDELED